MNTMIKTVLAVSAFLAVSFSARAETNTYPNTLGNYSNNYNVVVTSDDSTGA